MMMRVNMHQTLSLVLGLLYTVAATNNENLIVCGYERDLTPVMSLLKEKYPEYLSLFSCQYLNPSQKPGEATPGSKNGEKQTGVSTGNKLTKEVGEKRSVLLDVPVTRGDRYFNDRISMFATRNPIVEGYKRGPGFRSWGGKRSMLAEDFGDLDKRNRFSSWGGKRSDNGDDLLEKWLHTCEGKETCDEAIRREVENFNLFDRPLGRDAFWVRQKLFGR